MSNYVLPLPGGARYAELRTPADLTLTDLPHLRAMFDAVLKLERCRIEVSLIREVAAEVSAAAPPAEVPLDRRAVN